MGDAPNYGARDPMGPAKARWHLLQAGLWRIAARAPPHEGTELNARFGLRKSFRCLMPVRVVKSYGAVKSLVILGCAC